MGIFPIFNSKKKFYLRELNQISKNDDSFSEFLNMMLEDIQKKPNLIKTVNEIKSQILNVLTTLIKDNIDIEENLSFINDLIYSTNEIYESLEENSKELESYEEFIFTNTTFLISEILTNYNFSFEEDDIMILETLDCIEENLNYMAETPTSMEELFKFGRGKYTVPNFKESIHNTIEKSILNSPSIEKIQYLNKSDALRPLLNNFLTKMYQQLEKYEIDIVYALCIINPNIQSVIDYIKTIKEQTTFDFFHNNLIEIFYKSNISAYIELLNHHLNSKDIIYYSKEIEKLITNCWNENYYTLESIFKIHDIEKIISKNEQRDIKAQIGILKHQLLIENELQQQSDIVSQTHNLASEASQKAESAYEEASIANKKAHKAINDASSALRSSQEARTTANSAEYIARRN